MMGGWCALLPEYETVGQPIHAVFLHKAYMPAKVRAFIDHLAAVLKPARRA
jgi:DNA-binding transcriptional LysR family regulator